MRPAATLPSRPDRVHGPSGFPYCGKHLVKVWSSKKRLITCGQCRMKMAITKKQKSLEEVR